MKHPLAPTCAEVFFAILAVMLLGYIIVGLWFR